MEEKEKTPVKISETLQRDWEEARLCAELIRRGKARIVTRAMPDGSIQRYTKTVG